MIGDGGGGPMTAGQIVFLVLVFFGPTLICSGFYLIVSRLARKNAGRRIGAADHINALHAFVFTLVASYLVMYSVQYPILHAITVVLIPGILSSAILAWQWKSKRHGIIMACVTLAVAVLSIALDPSVHSPQSSEPSVLLFAIEPAIWLIAYGIVASRASASYGPRLLERMDSCVKCQYPLTGLTATICPECGTPMRHAATAAN